jgi:hypothetical protein
LESLFQDAAGGNDPGVTSGLDFFAGFAPLREIPLCALCDFVVIFQQTPLRRRICGMLH